MRADYLSRPAQKLYVHPEVSLLFVSLMLKGQLLTLKEVGISRALPERCWVLGSQEQGGFWKLPGGRTM
jgi:hypothetical protein